MEAPRGPVRVDKLRREGIRGREAANRAHFQVGAKVRQTIKDIGGLMPEQLPAEEDIKKPPATLRLMATPRYEDRVTPCRMRLV